MNNIDPVEALAQEVDDYLDISSVGLYEFMWMLNGDMVPGSKDEHREYALRALRSLLEQDRGRLVLLAWPSDNIVAELDREVQPEDFNDPGDDPYVAITRD
jgi:hypothetical protein